METDAPKPTSPQPPTPIVRRSAQIDAVRRNERFARPSFLADTSPSVRNGKRLPRG